MAGDADTNTSLGFRQSVVGEELAREKLGCLVTACDDGKTATGAGLITRGIRILKMRDIPPRQSSTHLRRFVADTGC